MQQALLGGRVFNQSFRVGYGSFTLTRFPGLRLISATSIPRDCKTGRQNRARNKSSAGRSERKSAGNEGGLTSPVQEPKCVMKIFRTCVCMYVYTAISFLSVCGKKERFQSLLKIIIIIITTTTTTIMIIITDSNNNDKSNNSLLDAWLIIKNKKRNGLLRSRKRDREKERERETERERERERENAVPRC